MNTASYLASSVKQIEASTNPQVWFDTLIASVLPLQRTLLNLLLQAQLGAIVLPFEAHKAIFKQLSTFQTDLDDCINTNLTPNPRFQGLPSSIQTELRNSSLSSRDDWIIGLGISLAIVGCNFDGPGIEKKGVKTLFATVFNQWVLLRERFLAASTQIPTRLAEYPLPNHQNTDLITAMISIMDKAYDTAKGTEKALAPSSVPVAVLTKLSTDIENNFKKYSPK